MPIGFFIFIVYLIFIIFSRLQKQTKKPSNFKKKQRDTLNPEEFPFIPDPLKYAENENNLEINDNAEKKEIILPYKEVEDLLVKKEIEKSIKKLPVIDQEKYISTENETLYPYFYDNLLIDGIILSELLGLPRALSPYKNRKHHK